MQKLGAKATSYDAQNAAQIAHKFEGNDIRYAVNPEGGELEAVQQLPGFSTLVEHTFNKVVLDASALILDESMQASYTQAAHEDAMNPGGVTDNLRRYSHEARTIDNASQRIRSLVKAMEASGTQFGPAFVGKLMIADIDRIAALAVLNSSAYYEPTRGRASFDRRLKWVEDHASSFQIVMNNFVATQVNEFQAGLTGALQSAQAVVRRAEAVQTDTQSPRAFYPDSGGWKVIRAL